MATLKTDLSCPVEDLDEITAKAEARQYRGSWGKHSRAGQGRAGPAVSCRAGQGKVGQSRAGQGGAGQNQHS